MQLVQSKTRAPHTIAVCLRAPLSRKPVRFAVLGGIAGQKAQRSRHEACVMPESCAFSVRRTVRAVIEVDIWQPLHDRSRLEKPGLRILNKVLERRIEPREIPNDL